MSFTARPNDTQHPPSEQETLELTAILHSLRIVRSNGGWGEVSISLKAADLVEIQTSYTEKVRLTTRVL